jgi:hypothetical protein
VGNHIMLPRDDLYPQSLSNPQHSDRPATMSELPGYSPLFPNTGLLNSAVTTLPEGEYLVARYGDGVLQLRRGGGLEFELGVLVQAFAILEWERRESERKKKKK